MNLKPVCLVIFLSLLISCSASEEKQKADSEIYFEIAKEYLAAGQVEKAVKEADNALQANPENSNAIFLKIEALAMLGKYSEAFAFLEEGAARLPVEKKFLKEYWKGIIFYHQKKVDEAVKSIKTSAELKPDFVENHILLSQIFGELNNVKEAITYAKKWTELDPKSGRAFETLGINLVRNKEYAKAKEALDEAVSLNPKSDIAYNYLGRWADEQKKWDEAERYYLKSLELNDGNSYVHLSVGQLLMATKRADEAIPHLERAHELDPNVPFTKFWIGRYHSIKGDYEAALDYYTDAVSLNPQFFSAMAGVADSSVKLKKNLDEAILLLESGFKKYPQMRRGAFYYLGKLYLVKGDLEKSMEYAENAAALIDGGAAKEWSDLYLLKGKIFSGMGNKKSAVEQFRLATNVAPDSESGKEAKKLLEN